MPKGRHAKESNNNTAKKIAIGTSVTLGAAVLPTAFANNASAATESEWDRVAQCESAGLWNRPDGHADSTGGLQIQDRTWADFGGTAIAPHAYQATKQQQIEIAEKILAVQGPRAWSVTWNGTCPGATLSNTPYSGGSTAPTPPPTVASSSESSQRDASEAAAKKVLELVNKERAKVGAGALALDEALMEYAYKHARKMAHEGRMYHSDLSFDGAARGENVAAGQTTAHEVVVAWMNSAEHRKTILSKSYSKMGLGLHDDGKPYWAQVFSGSGAAQAPASDPPDVTYVVKRGDWLDKIAKAHSVDGGWQKLYSANRQAVGRNPNLIHPGLKLTMPGHGGSVSPSSVPPPAPPAPKPKPPPAPAPAADSAMPVHGRVGDSLIVGNGGSMSRTAGGHSGLDISAPYGTPVEAASGGTVVSRNASGAAYGNHVVIKHGDGLYTLYAHLSSITVGLGASVAPGQQIGTVGSTGTSSGPHLHFEVRTDPTAFSPSVFLDPKAWLRSHGLTI